MSEPQQVWVAYATETQQFHIAVPYVPGMTAGDAIRQSAIEQQVALPQPLQLGIFGVKVENADHVLQAGDRVEIYRALIIQPQDIRRKRAAKNPVGRYQKGNRFKQSK